MANPNPDGVKSSQGATDQDSKLLEFISARHASIEQRGISVVTTTDTLVALLLALVGLADSNRISRSRRKQLRLPPLRFGYWSQQ
jgi:hypothetical protein